MYIPPLFRIDKLEDVLALIRQYPFALVQCVYNGSIESVHLPVHVLEESPLRLGVHLPRHNSISEKLTKSDEVYVVILGPHALIPGTWQFPGAVPTWNYTTVHARCTPKDMTGEELLKFLQLQTHTLLHTPQVAYDLNSMDTAALERRLKVLKGIELEVVSFEAIAKLSQDEELATKLRIKEHLQANGAKELCLWMDRMIKY